MQIDWRGISGFALAVPLALAAPVARGQEPASTELNDDEGKVLALLNLGIDRERAGDLDGAEKIYRRWIDETSRRYGENGAITSLGYRVLAGNLESQGRTRDAEPFWRRAVAASAAAFGARSSETLVVTAGLAFNLVKQGRPADALPLRRTILADRVALHGAASPEAVIATNNLANVLSELGQNEEAERLFRKAVATSIAVHGEAHAETAASYGNLAVVLRSLGRYGEAAPLLEKALAIDRQLAGADTPAIALHYYNISANLSDQGRLAEAGVAARKALDIWRATKGEESADTALGYTVVATNSAATGAFVEADPLFRKALAVRTKALGERHPLVAESYNNLAHNMANMGAPASAVEPMYRRALDIARATLGEENERTATMFANVAGNLDAQGRYAEAEPLYVRALQIREAIAGADHPAYATTLVNLASTVRKRGDYAEADALLRRALGIFRARFGEENADTAWAYSMLASNFGDLGRHDEAAAMAEKALNVRRRTLGDAHPLTAVAYNNLGAAITLQKADNDARAEPMYRQSLAMLQRSVGETHIDTAQAYNSLSSNLRRQGRNAEAEQASLKAVEILRNLRRQPAGGNNALALARLDRQQTDPDRNIFTNYINAAFGMMGETPSAAGQSGLQDKAFMAAQDAISSASGRAMLQTAARNAAKSEALAQLVRQEQDLAARANTLDARLLQALGGQQSVEATRLRGELDTIERDMADVGQQIDRKFPKYRDLVAPRPARLQDVQAALQPDEALLLMTEAANVVHIFVVTPGAVAWSRPPIEAGTILKQIADLRCDVDFATCSAARKLELDKVPQTAMEKTGKVRFDVATAHALYKELIAPVEPTLGATRRLYVASSGPLGDLPLAMLAMSDVPAGADIADPDVLARTRWLSDRFAFTSLPVVSALTLAGGERRKAAMRAPSFRGYGDPLLAGGTGGSRAATDAAPFTSVAADGTRLADPAILRSLAPLPGTKAELSAMATLFGQQPSKLMLEGAATEAQLRTDPQIATSSVIAIATHGLLPDPELGFGEPGLVLTPPATPSVSDDGLLTASEAAALTLSADWVILSACNTASAKGSNGSDSLSALARGFLYAGADGLLASHWRVSDEATAALTVETLAARRADPTLSRATALQRAMTIVRTGARGDGSRLTGWKAEWSHPSAWAPFTTIANRDD